MLRGSLLSEIQDAFPKADLVPVSDVDAPAEDRMATLPVRLVPGEFPVVPAAAVWEKVRFTLVTSWMAAIGVLAAAGIGFRNLVALTERRLQFAYAVTHELRTPLTTFQLYSDMLAAGLVPEESRQEYFETLNKESKRLSDLVEGVLEYARLENQKVTLHPALTTAPGLMQIISDQIAERCKRHGVTLKTENTVENGLLIRTDVDLIKQITGVLVNNACRHAGDSSDPTVIVRVEAEDDRLHLDVIDTGPGIERADARLVFRPFRRGRHAEKKAQSGIGLGLALARGWATLLGGRLELAARRHPQHGGAHFRLSIPRESAGAGDSGSH
jgi:signal transduction histidine kinase